MLFPNIYIYIFHNIFPVYNTIFKIKIFKHYYYTMYYNYVYFTYFKKNGCGDWY